MEKEDGRTGSELPCSWEFNQSKKTGRRCVLSVLQWGIRDGKTGWASLKPIRKGRPELSGMDSRCCSRAEFLLLLESQGSSLKAFQLIGSGPLKPSRLIPLLKVTRLWTLNTSTKFTQSNTETLRLSSGGLWPSQDDTQN